MSDTQCSYCDALNGGHTLACASLHAGEGKPTPKQIPVPLYCSECGAGEREHLACEEADCGRLVWARDVKRTK